MTDVWLYNTDPLEALEVGQVVFTDQTGAEENPHFKLLIDVAVNEAGIGMKRLVRAMQEYMALTTKVATDVGPFFE